MTTRGKNLNESSLNRIAYEEREIARIREAISAGKGNKRSQGALEKKLELVESIKAKMAARIERAASKPTTVVEAVEASESEDVVSNDADSIVDAALAAAETVTVDSLEDVAV